MHARFFFVELGRFLLHFIHPCRRFGSEPCHRRYSNNFRFWLESSKWSSSTSSCTSYRSKKAGLSAHLYRTHAQKNSAFKNAYFHEIQSRDFWFKIGVILTPTLFLQRNLPFFANVMYLFFQVSIYRFVSKNTVEEDILRRAKQKMVLDHLVC